MVKENEQSEYICGQCGLAIPYLKTEEPPDPCPECLHYGKDKDKYDVPSEFKYNLNQ